MVLTRWTNEMTKKFISLYKNQECLWNTDDPRYREKEARLTAYQVIWEAMKVPNLEVDEVNKKIKALRSTYMIERKKIKEAAQAGKSHKPCLAWFHDIDSFLKPHVKKAGMGRLVYIKKEVTVEVPHEEEPVDSEPEQSNDTDEYLSNMNEDLESSQENEENRSYTHEISFHTDMDPLETQDRDTGATSATSSKRPRLDLEVPELNPIITNERSLADTQSGDSEFDIFGKYIALQLKYLDDEGAIMARDEIQSVITRFRLKQIRMNRDRNDHEAP